MLMSPSSSPAALDRTASPQGASSCTSSHKAARSSSSSGGSASPSTSARARAARSTTALVLRRRSSECGSCPSGRRDCVSSRKGPMSSAKPRGTGIPWPMSHANPAPLPPMERATSTRFLRRNASSGREQTKGTRGHRAPSIRPGTRSKRRFTAKDAIVPQEHFDAAGPTVERVVVRPGDHQMLVHHPLGL